MTDPSLRRLATAGNAVALALLVVALANGERIFGGSAPPARGPAGAPRPRAASKVLLVVVDGLRRADLAPEIMPELSRLVGGTRGGAGTARLRSWLPTTVSGIRTMVEGRVPPPVSFAQDFGAAPSGDGGVFAAAKAAGLRSFAAGSRVWRDLYGPWLAGSFAVSTVRQADGRVLAAGLAALGGGYDLVAVHLSEPDDEAHLHGGLSPERRAALRRADAALGRLAARAGPGAAVVVTSDHGTTDGGGHAGPEPEVVTVPLVVRGPGLPAAPLADFPQERLPVLLLAPLGLAPPAPSPAVASSPLPPLLLAGSALALAALLCLRVPRLESAAPPTLLDAAFWIALALALLRHPGAALAVALAALAGALLLVRKSRSSLALAWAAGAGLLLGGLRLAAFGGKTASLSTLDIRLAFRLADGPAGLAGAAAVAVLVQALPILAVLLLASPGLARLTPAGWGRFAAGLGLVLLGEGAAAAAALAVGTPVAGPLGLGLLCRLAGEATFLFLGAVALKGLARTIRKTAP